MRERDNLWKEYTGSLPEMKRGMKRAQYLKTAKEK